MVKTVQNTKAADPRLASLVQAMNTIVAKNTKITIDVIKKLSK